MVLPNTTTVDEDHEMAIAVTDQFGNVAAFDSYPILLQILDDSGLQNHTVSLTAGLGSYVYTTTVPQTIYAQLYHAPGASSSLALDAQQALTILPGE